MQVCQNCGQQNPDSKLYCQHCGLALDEVPISTRQLDDPDHLSAGSDKLDQEYVIIIHIEHFEDDPVQMQLNDKAILGRTGGESSRVALINLDTFDADQKGVSRRHALLERDDDRLYISDLGSTNHTFLNGQQLQEHDRLVLRDGDHVRLGHLAMRIFFK